MSKKRRVDDNPLSRLPIPSVDGDYIPWDGRMSLIGGSYRFVPTTIEECNMAFNSQSFLNETGGVGRHLNEILLHQKKSKVVDTADASKAVVSVVGSMAMFWQDAMNRSISLDKVHSMLGEVNPGTQISNVSDELPTLGLLSVIQFDHIVQGVRSGSKESLQGGVKSVQGEKRLVTNYDTETNDDVLIKMKLERLQPATVRSVGRLAMHASVSHMNRRDFWEMILESSKTHMVAKPIVDNILH